jgi:hypothetical protein
MRDREKNVQLMAKRTEDLAKLAGENITLLEGLLPNPAKL